MSVKDKYMKSKQNKYAEHEDTLIAIGLRGKFSTEHTLSAFDNFHTFGMQQTPKVTMDDTVPFQLDKVTNEPQIEPRKMPVDAIKFTMSEQESLSCMKTFGTILYAPSEFKTSESINKLHVKESGTVSYVPPEFKTLESARLSYLKKSGVISYRNPELKITKSEEQSCINERGIVLYRKPKYKVLGPIKASYTKKVRAMLHETSGIKTSETVELYVKEPEIVSYGKPIFKVLEPIEVCYTEEAGTVLYEKPEFKISGTVKRLYVQEINGIPFEIPGFIISDSIGKLCMKKVKPFDTLLELIKDYELPFMRIWNRKLENVSTTLYELKKNVREFSLSV